MSIQQTRPAYTIDDLNWIQAQIMERRKNETVRILEERRRNARFGKGY
jgi:hypothetical protein